MEEREVRFSSKHKQDQHLEEGIVQLAQQQQQQHQQQQDRGEEERGRLGEDEGGDCERSERGGNFHFHFFLLKSAFHFFLAVYILLLQTNHLYDVLGIITKDK